MLVSFLRNETYTYAFTKCLLHIIDITVVHPYKELREILGRGRVQVEDHLKPVEMISRVDQKCPKSIPKSEYPLLLLSYSLLYS